MPPREADTVGAFRTLLGENDALAYLVNLATRPTRCAPFALAVRGNEGGTGRRPHARPDCPAAGEAGRFNAVQKLLTNPSPGACLSRASPGAMSFTGWCATIERQPMHDSNSRESWL